jgi:glutamate formiminotransferase / 5-formyltetrahydrofolate cyclo-ligase
MTAQVLEAVPNFSEGRDLAVVEAIVDAARQAGATVLDWSADPDHNRSVITIVGPAAVVETATLAAANVAFTRIDMRRHDGVHPRVGALDVLPFIPLVGLTLEHARDAARRVGKQIVDAFEVPVYFYGHASDPPGRSLADLRKGGFEQLLAGWPADREPDLMPARWAHPGAHPRAGVCCVGARGVLLAWNVFVRGLTYADARAIANALREKNSGLRGVRALALELPRRAALQISMNVEDPEVTSPGEVFRFVERAVQERGGAITETEVIGLMPDQLAVSVAAERMKLQPGTGDRLLSRKLAQYLADTTDPALERGE